MRTEPFGSQPIERYLETRGRRYFRGHHDGEYFFILPVCQERLHVHLELGPVHPDTFAVRVTPGCFFPATDRARLLAFADEWNRERPRAKATVRESSDQNRIGVVADNSYPIADNMRFEDFATLTDDTIRSAIELFAELAPGMWLRHAG